MILLVCININRVVTHFVLVNEREVFELEHTFEKKNQRKLYQLQILPHMFKKIINTLIWYK